MLWLQPFKYVKHGSMLILAEAETTYWLKAVAYVV